MHRHVARFEKFLSILHPDLIPSNRCITVAKEVIRWASEDDDLVEFNVTENGEVSIDILSKKDTYFVDSDGEIYVTNHPGSLNYMQMEFDWNE